MGSDILGEVVDAYAASAEKLAAEITISAASADSGTRSLVSEVRSRPRPG
jgi:hypothetical protein